MKKLKRITILMLLVAFALPALHSCRKGDEDPWFSIYSRKTRLCQNWKFSFYKRIEQYGDSTISYTFDGSSMHKIMPNNYQYISPCTMTIFFLKNGTYKWDQAISTDTSVYNYSAQGNWYFSGGSKNSDIKYKELLALQQTTINESLNVGGISTAYNYFGSGDLNTSVYRILKLSYDEVSLESRVETNYSTQSGSSLVIITTTIQLKKSI